MSSASRSTVATVARADRGGAVRHVEGFSEGRAPFHLLVGNEPIRYDVKAVAVLPGEELKLEATPATQNAEGAYEARDASGPLLSGSAGSWTWTAPTEPGIHPLEVSSATGATIRLNVLVMHPKEHVEDGALHGYAIGEYRQRPLRGNPAYLPPSGFVEVSPDDHDVLVSPHFTLGQFLCKQEGEPRFLAVSEPLVDKLEAVLAAVNRAGHDAPTLHVMSGFRTPAYNRAIGNKTVYSRHLWGDAADVFVDTDVDGEMDDLNGDGRVDLRDGRVLFGIVEALEASGGADVRPGGLGLYRRNAVHGPFVHVDARGHAARW